MTRNHAGMAAAFLMLILFAMASASTTYAQEHDGKPTATEGKPASSEAKPEANNGSPQDEDAWVVVDPESLPQERAWTPPHTKGNLWGHGFALLGPNIEYDPLWNLRWHPENPQTGLEAGPHWIDNDLWRLNYSWQSKSYATFPLTRDAKTSLQSLRQWRVRHALGTAAAEAPDGGTLASEFTLGEFHRRLNPEGTRTQTTTKAQSYYLNGYRGPRDPELANLADSFWVNASFSAHSHFLSARIFPAGDEKSHLGVYWEELAPVQPQQGEEGQNPNQDNPQSSANTTQAAGLNWPSSATYTYQPEGFPVLSRRGQSFQGHYYLRARAMNEAKTAYLGDLVSLNFTRDGYQETVLRENLTMAVETALVPLLTFSGPPPSEPADGTKPLSAQTLVLIEETPQGRRISAMLPNGEWKVLPTTPALKGIFLSRSSQSSGHHLMALIGGEVFRVDLRQGTFARRQNNPVLISGALGIPYTTIGNQFPSHFIVMRDGPKDPQQPVGKGFDFAIWDSSGLREVTTRDSLLKAMRPASWITSNSTMAKDIAALRKRGFDNTVLIYQSNIFLKEEEAKGFKNKNGSVIEFYQPNGGGDKDLIRLENNFGGDWLVATWDGTRQYEADDKTATMMLTRGKGDQLVNLQREARQMLLLDDIRESGDGALVYRGEEYLLRPWENDASKRVHCFIYSRWYPDDRKVTYWFDASGEHHDLVCVEMRFAVGEDVSQNRLWLSDFTLLPDLARRNPGPGMRVPGKVRGYHPQTRELRFEMTLLNSIRRKSYDNADSEIRSGYNWGELDREDFSSNYDLAK